MAEILVSQLAAEMARSADANTVLVSQLAAEMAYRIPRIWVYGVQMDDVSGFPMTGDRAARDATNYGSLHAKGIADGALQRHNTVPGAAGKINVSDGANWVEGNIGNIENEDLYLLRDGTRALSANWDAGSWQIRAETFQSDVVTGAAPLTVASTTMVDNLNADLHNSYHQSDLGIMDWMF